ncbi:alpha/beta hydrolase [Streptomyces smyrnaeus]|uniref:alpha/beta hydrolase n=1 Tax=Streptomyces smyrnaeus TaxID=1387713 RepID=UPI0027DCB828|nr:alpha/beta hydrolase [Streptomyces smyrnaeus]
MKHRPHTLVNRRSARFRTWLSALVLAAATVGSTGTANAEPETAPGTTKGAAAQPTASVTYDLGDEVYRLPGTGEPVEMAGAVRYPADLAHGRHPLVVLLHGWHETCADPEAEAARTAAEQADDTDAYTAASKKLFSWPCAAGTPALPSFRGYDYLSRRLASRGFVVVSLSANGINASSVWGDDNAAARADLINRHLKLWQRIDRAGTGALAGAFRHAATGQRENVPFAHHLDMKNVGIVGHSRAGAAVTWQAADRHRSRWPAGVRVTAAVAVAPAYNVMTENMAEYTVTRLPLAVLRGSCDGQVGEEALTFAAEAAAGNRYGFRRLRVQGANHNFFNTQWSPQSGQVAAFDDAVQVDKQPGWCTDRDGAPAARRLTEAQQRRVAISYIDAFMRRSLQMR